MPRWKEVAPQESDERCQSLDNAANLQLLEYYKHGDLLQFIGKLIGGSAVIQDKHGIKNFSCRIVSPTVVALKDITDIILIVIRGCIAQQYPPINFVDESGVQQTRPEIGPEIVETIPPVQTSERLIIPSGSLRFGPFKWYVRQDAGRYIYCRIRTLAANAVSSGPVGRSQ